MESLYKRKMFASMRKTKVAVNKKRQIGLPASILDDSDEGSFSSSSSGSQSDFRSTPEDSEQEDREDRDWSESGASGASSSDDSRSVTRRKRSFLGRGDDSSSSSSGGEEEEDGRSQPKRKVQPKKRSRLQRQDESDSEQTEEKRKEEAEKAKRRQRHNKLLALSRRMKARVPNRRRSRLQQVQNRAGSGFLILWRTTYRETRTGVPPDFVTVIYYDRRGRCCVSTVLSHQEEYDPP